MSSDLDKDAASALVLFLENNPENKRSSLTSEVMFTKPQINRLLDKKLITAEQHSQAQSYILRSDEFCVLNVPSFSTSTVKLAACLWVGVGAYAFSVLDDPTAAFYIWLGHTGSYVLITGQMVKENWDKMKSLRANEEVEIEEMEAAKSFANQLFDYARFFQRRRGPK